jgi:dihydroorotate dehydrogenase
LASYITINISSPNTPNLRSQHDDDKLTKLIDAIQKRRNANKSSIPILLKISPDIEDEKIKNLCDILIEKNIDGVILTNTTVQNKKNLLSEFKLEKGGLSGAPINELSNEIIKKFYLRLGKNIPIIGAGGVSCGTTAFEKIKSGATLLQLYTSLVYEGPNVAKKINKELSDLVKKSGYEKIEDAIGINCN